MNIYKCIFLQIEALSDDGETIDGPYTIVLHVVDVNNNPPVFNQSQYSGTIREHSPPGETDLLRCWSFSKQAQGTSPS